MSSTVAEAKRREASLAVLGVERAGRPLRRIQPGHQGVFPQPVQAARHQVVHQVVAVGDPVEDVVDQRLLLAGAHLAVAKGGLHASAGRDALI